MIWNDTTMGAIESIDQISIEKRPRGITMNHQERLSLTFIQVMIAMGT